MSRRVRLRTPLFSLVLEVHDEYGTITAFEGAESRPLIGWNAELLRDTVARAYSSAFSLSQSAVNGDEVVILEEIA